MQGEGQINELIQANDGYFVIKLNDMNMMSNSADLLEVIVCGIETEKFFFFSNLK